MEFKHQSQSIRKCDKKKEYGVPPEPKQAENKRTVKCRNCGGNFSHKNGPYPVKSKTCNYCKKQNHCVVVCMKKKQKERRIKQTDVQEIYESETEENSIMIVMTVMIRHLESK